MRRRLSMLWQQRESYWRLIPLKRSIQHRWSRGSRDLSNKGIDTSESVSRVRLLFKRTHSDLMLVLLATSAVYAADVTVLRRNYQQYVSLTAENYSDILLSIAGLTGVFIGLYYAALSAVGATLYSQFPVSIRSLLKEEKTGSTYMRFLSWLGFACIVLATLRALGLPPSPLCLVFSVAFCSVAIFGFAYLGRSVFDFFDPATLSYEVYASVQRQFKRVATAENSTETHETHKAAHFTASNSLKALDEIRNIVAPREHLKDSYIQLVRNAIRLYIAYSLTKHKIHPKSQWYPQEHKFDDWYRTGDSTTGIYVKTGTFTHPSYYSNHNWVEDALRPIINQCISDSLSTSIKQDIARLLSECAEYVRYRSYHGEIEDALGLCDQVIESYISSTLRKEDYQDQEWTLLADTACALYVESLTHYRAWHTKKIEQDLARVMKLHWGRNRVLAASPEGGRYTDKIIEISEQIAFEISVDGRRTTPDWFIEEHFRLLACARILPQIDRITQAASRILSGAENLSKNKRKMPALAVCSRLLEYLTKASGYLDEFERVSEKLLENRRIKGLVWSKVDYQGARLLLENSRTKLIAMAAALVREIPPHQPNSKLPDYAGQFLDTLAHDLLSALWKKDAERFLSLYDDFFLGSIAKYTALLPKGEVPDHMQLPALGLAISPIVDAMEIAGIGIVFSKAFELPAITSHIRSTWSRYLTEPDTSAQRKAFISAATKFSLDTLSPVPREITRTSWRLELLRQLKSLPRKTISSRGHGLLRPSHAVADHADALVRVFASDLGLSPTGVNAFAIEILGTMPGEGDIDLGFQYDQLKDRIGRSMKLWDTNSGDGDD